MKSSKIKYIILKLGIVFSFGFQLSNNSTSEIEVLYIEALNNRFDLLLSSGYKYVELNTITSKVKDRMPSNSIYKFLDNKELIRIASKRRNELIIYRIAHKELSADTIDINFSLVRLSINRKIHWNKGLKFKRALFNVDYDETKKYTPDFRFVKNLKSNKWEMNINRYISEGKK